MESLHKLAYLSNENFALESDGIQECAPQINGDSYKGIPISEVIKGGGQKMKILKSMLTTACERNCYYCPFRAGRNTRRVTIQPEEMAKTFMEVFRTGAVEGIFLSSGIIKGSITTQDKLIDTADILRNKRGYKGYLHLKMMPGLEKDQLHRAMQLANRVSVNLEAPNTKRLLTLAPKKYFIKELLHPIQWAHDIRQEEPIGTWNGRWASTVTQFVIGAVGESDLELVDISERLYRDHSLQRAYYSPFKPIQDTPLENLPPEEDGRKTRLYQTSFLLRDYGFTMEEMPFDQSGNLPRHIDPKLAIAQETLLHKPTELNSASREELLRVPGIGPKGADILLRARRVRKLASLSQLHKLGIQAKRANNFILLDGKRPARQISMF